MTSKKRQQFSSEFRAEAIKLASEVGIPKAAKELGILENNIRRWKHQAEKKPTSRAGEPSYQDLQKEVKRLRREMEYMGKINEVLKNDSVTHGRHFL